VSPRLGLPLPARGSFGAATCPRGSGSRSRLRAAPGPPRVPTAQAPVPGSGQLWGRPHVPAARAPAPSLGQLRGRHVSPRLGLPFLARGSSGDATYPHGSGFPSRLGAALGLPRVPGLCGLQASKQISSGDPAIMISIGAGALVSSKALRDKGCSTRSQGMQQAAH
jgi:hypothetical protein